MTVLVGLHGRLTSGKDTAFGFIKEAAAEGGLVAVRQGFADKLKLSAVRALGYRPGNMEETLEICNELKSDGHKVEVTYPVYGLPRDSHSISGREYLQFYGTEAHRDVFGYDFWVDALLPTDTYTGGTIGPQTVGMEATGKTQWKWHNNFEGADIAVVTDVRFRNEAERIRELGGKVWEIWRGNYNGESHASEIRLATDMIDGVIDNTGTLDDLRQNVRASTMLDGVKDG